MSPVGALVWLVTAIVLGWALVGVHRRSRGFAASALVGVGFRRVTRVWAPALEAALLLSLLGVAVVGRLPGGDAAAEVFIGLAALAALALGVVVALQGFALGERLKRRGDDEGGRVIAARGFAALLLGCVGVLVTLFAAFGLSTPGR